MNTIENGIGAETGVDASVESASGELKDCYTLDLDVFQKLEKAMASFCGQAPALRATYGNGKVVNHASAEEMMRDLKSGGRRLKSLSVSAGYPNAPERATVVLSRNEFLSLSRYEIKSQKGNSLALEHDVLNALSGARGILSPIRRHDSTISAVFSVIVVSLFGTSLGVAGFFDTAALFLAAYFSYYVLTPVLCPRLRFRTGEP